MKRTGFKKRAGIEKRARINPVSEKRQRQNEERATIPMEDHCEAASWGAPGDCYGPLTKHEVLTRARGGSITDPKNIRTVCSEHNRLISQDVACMRWALANGFLERAR